MEDVVTPAGSAVRRHLVGLAGLALLAVGVYSLIWPPQEASSELMQGSCIKAGLVLLAFWLAFPQLDRLPMWAVVSSTLALLIVAVRPQILLTVVRLAIVLSPLLGILWLLRPQSWAKFRETPPGRILLKLIALASTTDHSKRRLTAKPQSGTKREQNEASS